MARTARGGEDSQGARTAAESMTPKAVGTFEEVTQYCLLMGKRDDQRWLVFRLPNSAPFRRFGEFSCCRESDRNEYVNNGCEFIPNGASGELTDAEKLAQAIQMLAEWVVAVSENGTGWDDWDTHYKHAQYGACSFRDDLDKAIKEITEGPIYARRSHQQ
jgi:hypothetical protein